MKSEEFNQSFTDVLDNFLQTRQIKVVSFIPSKGGCGNSCLALNFAYALAQKNKKVLLLDANLSMPSLDIMLGQGVSLNLQDVLEGDCELDHIVHHLEDNIGLIAGSTNYKFWSDLSINAYIELLTQASNFKTPWEYLIIDCANGLSNENLIYPITSDENILVMNNEPASLSKAYGIIKTLSQRHCIDQLSVLSNMVFNQRDGYNTFKKLDTLMAHQSNIQLNHIGSLPFSWEVRDAVRNQQAFVQQYPQSLASKSLLKMSDKLEGVMVDRLL